jgi:hypothetical protein
VLQSVAGGGSKRVTDEEEEEEEDDDDDDDDDDEEEEEEEGEKERALLGTPFQKRGVSPAHGLRIIGSICSQASGGGRDGAAGTPPLHAVF